MVRRTEWRLWPPRSSNREPCGSPANARVSWPTQPENGPAAKFPSVPALHHMASLWPRWRRMGHGRGPERDRAGGAVPRSFVKLYPLPKEFPDANLNTAAFDTEDVVHRTEWRLWPPRSGNRRGLGIGCAGGARTLRHHDEPIWRRVVRLPRRRPYRADRYGDRRRDGGRPGQAGAPARAASGRIRRARCG